LRKYQLFACAEWTGYVVVNNAVQSSKSGGPLAAAWAVMRHLGEEGYLERCREIQAGVEKIVRRIDQMEGIRVLGRPEANLIAVTSDEVSVFQLAALMEEKGWHLQVQLRVDNSPESIHFTVIPPNIPHLDTLLDDLQECLDLLKSREIPQALQPEQLRAFAEMIRQEGPGAIEKLGPVLSTGEGGLPDMTVVNTLLNEMPPAIREELLKQFVNELFK
jgi:glutamate/tyrosine decarboxylase-like PLP-dependent enzyme